MKAKIAALIAQAAAYLNTHTKVQGLLYIVRDSIEGGLAAVVALNVAFPQSIADAKSQGLIVVTAFAGAAIAVFRREVLPFIQSALGL